jgi:ADP-ribose pyrophosphatase
MLEVPLMLPISFGDETVVYENQYQRVYSRTVSFANFEKQYFVTDYGERAAVVLISLGGVLLTRQYRHLIDGLSWEIPGGRVEPGETVVAAAQRECLEETGLVCGDLRPLIQYHPGLDTVQNHTHVFSAELAEQTLPPHSPDTEVFSREWVALDSCMAMIADGQINDSLSLIALLAYDRFRGTGH